ncbi:retrovirus-related pol polyprotein from transposon TNT 1-94 [Tanacetum coccineum]|uniref:Retrovirus-related pol polyprotein from transposon TNT 1-94 n=1 Tax=Tanacetum coccineum TaxID=301880 RepID=A0ABQ5G8Z1_9ASTR
MDTTYRTSWIRRIEPPGYGVSDLLDTAYGILGCSGTVFCTSWVRRIELLGYGVLAESVLFLIFDQSIIYDVLADVDTAYSSMSGNGLLIRQSLGYTVLVSNNTAYLLLDQITLANVVPPKKTTSHSVKTQKPELKVYSRIPKNVKNTCSSKKAKIGESKNANHSEPNHTWGSNATDISSSSSLVMTACALGKIKKSSHQPKSEDTNQEKLYLLHMDFCGPMHVARFNGERYILVIVDDYSRFTWVRFLRLKDKAPEAIIKCIKNIQVRLNATVRNVRTDNGTKFVNQTLHEFYENVSISHQTSIARTPQQNGIVKRQNQTLVEAARTMLIFSKALLFLCAEAINTACYTQNRSLIRHRYNKTPYELMQDKKPDLSFFHVFGALCYPTNDNDDLGKLDAKADIGIFVGYAPAKKAFRIYNKRTQKIIETIHVTFDELPSMASEQFSSGHGIHSMTLATSSLGLVPNPIS